MNHNAGKLLKNEFNERQRKNPSYSQRAFSRDLMLSPSFLSDVMNGKRALSIDRAFKICRALGWNFRESQIFLQTTQLSQAKSKKAQQFLKKEIRKIEKDYGSFKSLKLHQFSLVSDWYYMALLELADLEGFRDDPAWIAARLGIQYKEAEAALIKLKYHKFLVQHDSGCWRKNINAFVRDTPSADLRKFHRQQLLKAADALEAQAFNQRHLSGVTMAIDTDRLPEAKQLIQEFCSRMSALLEAGQKKNVYHLAVQLFQLDQNLQSNSREMKSV